ncbi:diguanylate cyclase [Rhizobium sp. CSW-27]|uniref:diguanylate cyclase n=1 Tax=Rhizobium sp. CSW-27 TaxID=2839985 RepID=UPI001C02C4D4|nr:diguanylate cyclase [Rhizobium sp. CSW-27]MBT9372474.1 diguanylate cyclase [Rhizobium sp. CSW-27]
MPMIPQMPPEAPDTGHQAVTLLTRLGLDLTPANFELMTLLLDGQNGDLRQAFAGLKRPILAEEWDALARRFLPQHFVPHADLVTGLALLQALGNVRAALVTTETGLAEQGRAIEKGRALLAASADMSGAQLAHVAARIAQANARACDLTKELLAVLADWKETHPLGQPEKGHDARAFPPAGEATAREPSPVASASPAPVVLHGLAERAVLMGRLQDLHTGGQKLDGSSLMLCHLKGLDGYRGPDMLKARDFVLDTLGQQTQRLMGEGDLACWMSPEELGLLLDANNDLMLTDISQKLRRIVAGSVNHARRNVPNLPELRCHIGCASAFGPVSPGQLYSSAKLALQRAEFAGDDRLVINDLSGPLKVDRRYDALYGRRMQ